LTTCQTLAAYLPSCNGGFFFQFVSGSFIYQHGDEWRFVTSFLYHFYIVYQPGAKKVPVSTDLRCMSTKLDANRWGVSSSLGRKCVTTECNLLPRKEIIFRMRAACGVASRHQDSGRGKDAGWHS